MLHPSGDLLQAPAAQQGIFDIEPQVCVQKDLGSTEATTPAGSARCQVRQIAEHPGTIAVDLAIDRAAMPAKTLRQLTDALTGTQAPIKTKPFLVANLAIRRHLQPPFRSNLSYGWRNAVALHLRTATPEFRLTIEKIGAPRRRNFELVV
jgi:hypothetical protein